MLTTIKKIGTITLITFLGVVATYTLLMGLFFSLTGMWVTETNLMIGYTATFCVSACAIFFLLRKEF